MIYDAKLGDRGVVTINGKSVDGVVRCKTGRRGWVESYIMADGVPVFTERFGFLRERKYGLVKFEYRTNEMASDELDMTNHAN